VRRRCECVSACEAEAQREGVSVGNENARPITHNFLAFSKRFCTVAAMWGIKRRRLYLSKCIWRWRKGVYEGGRKEGKEERLEERKVERREERPM